MKGIITGDKRQIIEALCMEPDDETRYKIKRIAKHRTLQQNKYMHSIFGIITNAVNEEQGYKAFEMEDIKIMLKEKFLKIEYKQVKGSNIKIIQRTRDMTTQEMTDFVKQIKDWTFNTFNFILPDPDDKRLFDWIDNNTF